MFAETVVQISDVDDAIAVLGACLNLLQAKDLYDAQIALRNIQPSPLTQEVELVKTRFSNYLADYLVQQHLATRAEEDDEDDVDDLEYLEEPQEGSEELVEGSEEDLEELSSLPLGEPKVTKQKGRRLDKSEI